jgi:archaellum component FlaC
MMMRVGVVAALTVAGAEAASVSAATQAKGNPIRKVVTMLQMITKKIEKEGKENEDLHEQFICECNKNQASLQKAIDTGAAAGSDQAAALAQGGEQQKQLVQDISDEKAARASAKETIATSTSIREKEAKAFAEMKADSEANIASMTAAIKALRAGTGGSFLQTDAAKTLRDLVQTEQDRFSQNDREELSAFLQSGQSTAGTGEIIGMLEQLKEEMSKDLADATATEEDAIKTFNELVAAKTKEFETLQASIEEKMTRLGELGVANAELSNAGGDTADAGAADAKALADLKAACEKRQKEYEGEVKSQAEELLALADTIHMLNDDDALELFKKALPSAASSFMQMTASEAALRTRALALVHAAHQKHKKSDKLAFLALALHGKRKGFDKVVALIDRMAAQLKVEQKMDNEKKDYCLAEFDKADDEKKALERKVSDSATAIMDAKETLASLVEEIKKIQAGVKELDTNVADATSQRQEENAVYKQTMAENVAAKALIEMAKNRMNKFYNPSLYKAAPKRELSEEDRIAVNMGGTAPPTPAPGGIAGTGIKVFMQVDAGVQKKGEMGAGVIAMMDLLLKDLDNQITVGETEEKNAQEDYETAMEDAKTERAANTKLLGEKMSAKAETDSALEQHTEDKASFTEQLQGNGQYIASLHADCDWLLEKFDQRKEARTDEIDAMLKAKDVLNGADYSLLQVTRAHLRGHQ